MRDVFDKDIFIAQNSMAIKMKRQYLFARGMASLSGSAFVNFWMQIGEICSTL